MPMSRLPGFSLLAGAVLSLAACTTPQSLLQGERAPDAAVPVAAAANDNLNAVLWVQRSQEYRANALQTWRAAAAQLDRALADPGWTALLPEEGGDTQAPGLKPAVVVDVDETVLDNSPYQARLVRDGGSYDDVSWDAWVSEGKAGAVPGAVAFAQAAAAKGVTLIYITNRTEHMKAVTLANLRRLGFPVAGDDVYLGVDKHVPGCAQEGSEKACRRRLVAQQYRVLMQVGDQLGDFAAISANTQAGRDGLLQAHQAWFGQRWWMLSNPTYGGWEAAQFDNAWSRPEAERRAAKHGALDVAQ
ncbi:5'-nucleotidase, lipoprotein e(P4) family [Stenotrophomonas mori]|uniref:Acid phosphatase n=1 Tax=Stenotrophomonas mori TaxID=2871096 RepID=A0ABT0SHH4_9GAMM|nr:HAD family acid phosphatase [Stenotrophomonas mori]MCL7714783.1 acid phosphatase [Stenotrophomonas mori]